jgi:hypothetical protein
MLAQKAESPERTGRMWHNALMRLLVSVVMLFHGSIHLMGFAKAFGYAELRELRQEISRAAGILWLLCTVAFFAAGFLFFFRQDAWWWFGLPAVVLSQVLIVRSWRDAKFGTLANLVLLVPLAAAVLDALPSSYRNEYQAIVDQNLASQSAAPLVREADLAPLPGVVQRYLVYTGALGKPRVRSFRAVYQGDFRNGLDRPWMRFHSEQYDFLADPPTRVFWMKAGMFGLPAEGLHVFRGESATMRIKVASLFQVADARGSQMNQGETVTLFNDLCVMAPAALIDTEHIRWEPAGPLEARARYTRLGVTISALLSFNAEGQLVDFVSSDRFYSVDGKTYVKYPWSTPLRDYRVSAGRRLPTYAETVWHMPQGEFCYGRFSLVQVDYNVSRRD